MTAPFRVGISRDVLDSRGEPSFGRAALKLLDDAPSLEWDYLPAGVREVTPDHAARYDALYVNMVRTPASAVAREDCRLRVVARHGVGYDSVDVPAMTRAGVIVTNTPTAMPRPVATTALTFILALAGKLLRQGPPHAQRAAGTSASTTWGPGSPAARWAWSAPAASARRSCAWRGPST